METNSFIKKRGKVLFFKELMISLILLSLPVCFLLLDTIPEESIYETGWFTINSEKFGFTDINQLYWFCLVKAIPLIVLTFWYFTCSLWWRSAILVPLTFSLAQLIYMLTSENSVDFGEFWIAFIFSLPIIVIFYSLANKSNIYNCTIQLNKTINEEIDELISKIGFLNNDEIVIKHMNKFETIKRQKFLMNEEHYLYKIMALKNQIILDINKFKQQD